MAHKTAVRKETQRSAAGATRKAPGFTTEERAAMKARSRELKSGNGDGESELLAKIAEMRGTDRAIAERLREIVKAAAPALTPRTWYGMPAYAKDGKAVS